MRALIIDCTKNGDNEFKTKSYIFRSLAVFSFLANSEGNFDVSLQSDQRNIIFTNSKLQIDKQSFFHSFY